MKIKASTFVISAVSPTQYPEDALPEIAMAGRSNVGKSSLINMLLNRKGLAKTSSTPGKTRLINFYDVDGKFRLVDLPGYGYARVAKESKKSWAAIIETYLKKRDNLMEVLLLVDGRHTPSAEDKQMYEWIRQCGFNGIVIVTKADKLTRSQLGSSIATIRKTLGMDADGIIMPISSETRYGKYDLWDAFNELFEVNGHDVRFERQVSATKPNDDKA